ncbi:hypothetical protein [Tolypothrix sp. NIES-4075]|nr:hypothetical protein [Tolypothrix sp. NIES-4075]
MGNGEWGMKKQLPITNYPSGEPGASSRQSLSNALAHQLPITN